MALPTPLSGRARCRLLLERVQLADEGERLIHHGVFVAELEVRAADVGPAIREGEAALGFREGLVDDVAVGDDDSAVTLEELAAGLRGAAVGNAVHGFVRRGDGPLRIPTISSARSGTR